MSQPKAPIPKIFVLIMTLHIVLALGGTVFTAILTLELTKVSTGLETLTVILLPISMLFWLLLVILWATCFFQVILTTIWTILFCKKRPAFRILYTVHVSLLAFPMGACALESLFLADWLLTAIGLAGFSICAASIVYVCTSQKLKAYLHPLAEQAPS